MGQVEAHRARGFYLALAFPPGCKHPIPPICREMIQGKATSALLPMSNKPVLRELQLLAAGKGRRSGLLQL